MRASASTSAILSAVGITSGSFWNPSRGPTSRMLTEGTPYIMPRPPLTPIVSPVTNDASSLAR